MLVLIDVNNIKWRKVKGVENYYVSYMGEIYNKKRRWLLKPKKNPQGYLHVVIRGKNRMIHRLVADAFIENPNPINFNVINHKDGDKENNAFINLEWCTQKANLRHARITGLNKMKYDLEVRRAIISSRLSVGKIAKMLKAPYPTIYSIRHRSKIR